MNRKSFLSFFSAICAFASTWSACEAAREAPKRIACVGDSITYGAAIKDRVKNCYPAQLGRMLGEKFEVRNFGVNGATLLKKGDKPYWKLKAYANARDFQPEVVVIKLGIGSAIPFGAKRTSIVIGHRRTLGIAAGQKARIGHLKD